MFDFEANVWFNIPEFNLLAQNLTVPGFSPLYPDAHCTADGSVCLLTTGQAEINAASTISALLYSRSFNLTATYFLVAGIAGVNPKLATIGAVTFARYAVQVHCAWTDARVVGRTEVFEVNDNLRQLAFGYAKTAKLNDTADAQAARALYQPAFAAGSSAPNVVLCDTATSDTYWSGNLLGATFENTTRVFTNNGAEYCTTQQEDNATLNDGVTNLVGDAPGFNPSLLNLHLAGVKVVMGIVSEWNTKFAHGVKPTNYIGDVFGSLGGEPDFGPGSIFGGKGAKRA
ncbi:purine nucleoside permease [Mycena leptocephala]|nr:purine nucleoside permease [Mycena leptocephala]